MSAAHQLHDDAGNHFRLMVAELTTEHRHRERYEIDLGPTRWARFHSTKVPSLLNQLEQAFPGGDGASRGAGYESRPAMRVEAYDGLVRIDLAASRWVRDLGEDDPDDTIACVRLLGSLAASARRCTRRTAKWDLAKRTVTDEAGTEKIVEVRKVACCTWHAIEADVRRWWQQARILTGWDSPAWRPDATCPHCRVRGALRIRLEDRTGLCVECRETFGPEEYQQLAEHVRLEADERRRATVTKLDVRPGQNRGW